MNNKEKYELLFNKRKHKDNQLSQRLSVFFTGTSLLLVAFFVSYGADANESFAIIRITICSLGISFSIGITSTIYAGYRFTESLVNKLIKVRKEMAFPSKEQKEVNIFEKNRRDIVWWQRGHQLAALIPLGPLVLWVLCLLQVLT